MAKITEGFMPFHGYQTYYRIVGEQIDSKKPLLTIHGGPGSQHDYLESLDGIAEEYGRQVIYYDQIGCGKSLLPISCPDMWCEELFMEELIELRKHLGLDECHILGQSWGGMLLMKYALTQPEGVDSMIVASSPADISLWCDEAIRLMDYMPAEYADVLKRCMETGDYSGEEFEKAYAEYYSRFVYAQKGEKPEFLRRPKAGPQPNEVYLTMQGHGEFEVTGKMKTYNVVDRLHEITIPTLVTSGLMDECTPLIAKQVADGIPGAKWSLFRYSAHLVHAEEPVLYNKIVEEFLEDHE